MGETEFRKRNGVSWLAPLSTCSKLLFYYKGMNQAAIEEIDLSKLQAKIVDYFSVNANSWSLIAHLHPLLIVKSFAVLDREALYAVNLNR